jgi:hypothetical protein
MIMLLRELGIPSRLVMGYLPGQLQGDGAWQVRRSAAHAWVEVYFPTYGWVPFDPTPGNTENGQRPSTFEAGSPLPTSAASPGASGGGGRRTFGPATPSPVGGGGGAPASSDGGSGGALLIALLVLLGAGLLILAVAIRERRGPMLAPDAVYRGVAGLAGWFGYGPRPTQTTYEYASGLGDLVPAARPELELVARAKVEATYGRRQPGPEGLVALRAAYRRLRFRLLTLALRRQRRR